ncbi:MAG: site-2 protease family protein [Candidatus Gracilibacteria bacterium]
MIIIGIIVSIILFSIIVLVHEGGHFSAARFFGVRVEEFGLGIPPRAKKLFRDKKGTLFTLNWLPIGGFVRLTGEIPNTFLVYNKKNELYNNEDLEKDIKGGKNIFVKGGIKIGENDKKKILKKLKENKASYNLMNKPSWQQAIIILAGVFMNFLLASIIFGILFFTGIKPIGINTKIETDLNLRLIPTYEQALESGLLLKNKGILLSPVEGSIAEIAGIKQGDILLDINGIQINTPEKMIDIISNNAGKKVEFKINTLYEGSNIEEKESRIISINIFIPKEGKIGAYISENITLNTEFEYKFSALKSAKYGISETYNQTLLTFKGLGILVKKIFNPETPEERTEALSQVRGPVGIVDFISNSLEGGFTFLVVIGAIISINLGVFNLLPIPALDGGRFLFITINSLVKKIFGKKAISEKTEGIIHVGFFIFLIALSLLIAYNDINTIILR